MREFPKTQASALARNKIGYEFFTVQAGAFSNHSGATRRYNQLRSKGLPVRIENQGADGRTLQVVLVGKYKDLYQANQSLKKVKSIVPDARIVP